MKYTQLAMGIGEVKEDFFVRVGNDLKESFNGGSDKDLFPLFYLYTFFTTIFLQLPFSIINHATLSLNLALESRSAYNPLIWLQFILDLASVFINPITRPVESFKQLKAHFKTAIAVIILGLLTAGAAYKLGYLAFIAEIFADIAFLISATLAWEIIIGIAIILYLPSFCGQILKFISEFNKDENVVEKSVTQKHEPLLFEKEDKVEQKVKPDKDFANNYEKQSLNRNENTMLQLVQQTFPHITINQLPAATKKTRFAVLGAGTRGTVVLNTDNTATKTPINGKSTDAFNELAALTASEAAKKPGQETHIIGFHGCSDFLSVTLVLEVANMNLTDLIAKGTLDTDRINEITIEIAEGLAYLHDFLRLVHGDLKTDNILITSEGTVKIADFGCAKALTIMGSTYGNAFNGTPTYVAPERLLFLPSNHLPEHLQKNYIEQYSNNLNIAKENITYNSEACDIYSLGGIRFAMESGEQPYRPDKNRMTLTQMTTYLIVSKGNPLAYHKQHFGDGGVKNIKEKDFSENLMLATWNYDPTKRPTASQIAKTTSKLQTTF